MQRTWYDVKHSNAEGQVCYLRRWYRVDNAIRDACRLLEKLCEQLGLPQELRENAAKLKAFDCTQTVDVEIASNLISIDWALGQQLQERLVRRRQPGKSSLFMSPAASPSCSYM